MQNQIEIDTWTHFALICFERIFQWESLWKAKNMKEKHIRFYFQQFLVGHTSELHFLLSGNIWYVRDMKTLELHKLWNRLDLKAFKKEEEEERPYFSGLIRITLIFIPFCWLYKKPVWVVRGWGYPNYEWQKYKNTKLMNTKYKIQKACLLSGEALRIFERINPLWCLSSFCTYKVLLEGLRPKNQG